MAGGLSIFDNFRPHPLWKFFQVRNDFKNRHYNRGIRAWHQGISFRILKRTKQRQYTSARRNSAQRSTKICVRTGRGLIASPASSWECLAQEIGSPADTKTNFANLEFYRVAENLLEAPLCILKPNVGLLIRSNTGRNRLPPC